MIITARLDDASLALRLQSMGIIMRSNIRDAVTRAAVMLTRYVKEQKLSGQVLKNRTGTLRRKINYTVTETPNEIQASVGVKLSYAAVHEYGFDGTVSVRAHVRQVHSRDRQSLMTRKTTGLGIGFVRAHERHMHIPERSYLRSSLAENALTIRDMLAASVGAQ